MFNKYFVIQIVKNMSDGVSQSIEAFDTEKIAKDKFYDKLSSLGGNPQTKTVRVVMLNADGLPIKDELIDNSIYAPIEE